MTARGYSIMGKCEKLLAKAENNPKGLRFAELCQLAECHGYEHTSTKGSHHKYQKDGYRPMVFQEVKGEAKAYQVRQLLDAITS